MLVVKTMKIDFFNKTHKRKIQHVLISNLTAKNKYQQFKMVEESYFLNKSDKSNFYIYYRKNIRTYLFFKKMLSKKYENLQRCKYDNNLDLSLNPLKHISKISLFHHKKLYSFDIFDLLKIIKNALYFNNDLFPESQYPKNPYNNKEFTIGNFINMYLYMRSKYMAIPSYFEDFRRSGFCLHKYVQMNEPIIKINCIKDYCDSMSMDEMYGEIIVMLRDYNIKNAIIHPAFPREKVVDQFKDNINNYFIHCYSHHPILRLNTKKKNKEAVKSFFHNNPSFGRIIYNRNDPLRKTILEIEAKYKYLNYLSEKIPDYNYFEDIENFNTINEEDLLNQLNEYTEEEDDDDDDNFSIRIGARNNQSNENQRTSTPFIDDEDEDGDDAIWNRHIDENLNIILQRTDRNLILNVRNRLQSQIYHNHQNNEEG